MRQFTANRLAGGNRIFPAEIHIDDYGVTLKIPGFLGGKEQSLGYDKVSSIKIDSPMIGFSKITFHTIGWSWDSIVAEGFEKADAEEIKRLVQTGIQSVRHGNSGGSGGGPAVDMSHVIAQSEAAKALAELEKQKIDLEQAKHRQEVEEKEAAKRKEKADEYRKRGKHTLAFFVEMNPIYLIGIIVVVICLGVAGYNKYEEHAQHAEVMAEISKMENQPNNSNSQRVQSNTQPVTTPPASDNSTPIDTVKEKQAQQQSTEPQPAAAEQVTNTVVYYKIQDPDGYTNLRKAPNGEIIRKVYPNEKFEVVGLEDQFNKVKFTDGTVGFIHQSRVIKVD